MAENPKIAIGVKTIVGLAMLGVATWLIMRKMKAPAVVVAPGVPAVPALTAEQIKAQAEAQVRAAQTEAQIAKIRAEAELKMRELEAKTKAAEREYEMTKWSMGLELLKKWIPGLSGVSREATVASRLMQ